MGAIHLISENLHYAVKNVQHTVYMSVVNGLKCDEPIELVPDMATLFFRDNND